ncbi:MAG: zinc ribbon domain-containing protein [Chloroflexi bacterium]|nr:zinc ribbon domain-containing protein [Chloroflexota bacterium]
MPVYEYRCSDCGDRFEKLVSMSLRDAQTPCPACGHGTSRQPSIAAMIGASAGSAGGGCGGCAGGCACARQA